MKESQAAPLIWRFWAGYWSSLEQGQMVIGRSAGSRGAGMGGGEPCRLCSGPLPERIVIGDRNDAEISCSRSGGVGLCSCRWAGERGGGENNYNRGDMQKLHAIVGKR